MIQPRSLRLPFAAVLASCTLALSGCGDEPPRVSSATTTAHAAVAPASVHKAGGVSAARHTKDYEQTGGATAQTLHPCTLVSADEAQAIIGQPIARRVEAPQGPTCIYTPRTPAGSRRPARQVTIGVSAMSFEKARAQLSSVFPVRIRGHGAYCGAIGNPIMFVPLSGGRVMTVSAPCPIAASLASKALSRLRSA
jgi:hypothetical protein